MVEELTSTNQELSARIAQLQEEVGDLESAVELSEEIDVSQRQEITSLRYDLPLYALM